MASFSLHCRHRVKKIVFALVYLICVVGALRTLQPIKEENAVKIIKTNDGDIVDCVDIYKQPAFSHPLLKDHKLQMRPTFHPSAKDMQDELRLQENDNIGGCPEGSIPIQRLQHVEPNSSMSLKATLPNNWIHPEFNKYWAVRETVNGRWYGGGASINVYGVPNVRENQSSSSLIWVFNREVAAAVKAGWTVDPSRLGDTNTRLFISWTADNGQTSCYNLECPGFVQINRNVVLGSSLQPLSTYRGQQYVIKVYLYKEPVTGNWWFSFGSPSNYVGYWPSSLFRGFDYATQVHYGGYVDCPPNQYCPSMGNGHLPHDDGCFFQDVQYVSVDNALVNVAPQDQLAYANSPECYGVGDYVEQTHGFRFGGPGC